MPVELVYLFRSDLHEYFAQGAPATLTGNINPVPSSFSSLCLAGTFPSTNPTRGLAKGTACLLHSLLFEKEEEETKFLQAYERTLPGEILDLNELFRDLQCNSFFTPTGVFVEVPKMKMTPPSEKEDDTKNFDYFPRKWSLVS